MVGPDQPAAAQAAASPVPGTRPADAAAVPAGYGEFYRDLFRDLVKTAMYGPIAPINVLEPLLSLQDGISGLARTRPLRAVPTGSTG